MYTHIIILIFNSSICFQVSPSYQAWGLNLRNDSYDVKYTDGDADGDADTTAGIMECTGASGTDSPMDPPRLPMDWSKLPHPINMEAELEKNVDLASEINRAKSHKCFPFFMQWFTKAYDLPHDHIWGKPDDDPVEDLCDFITFLVEAGYGNFACTENMETNPLHDATSVEETRMH